MNIMSTFTTMVLSKARLAGVCCLALSVMFLTGCHNGSSGAGVAAGGGTGALLLAGAPTLDLNGDGLLSRTEATDDGTLTGTPLTTAAFDALDLNSDGSLGLNELIGVATLDFLNGGQLYDKWWVVSGDAAPTTDHPLWATQTGTNARTGADTWRCKECHGWDYIGAAGRYGTGSHHTGFAGIVPLVVDITRFDVFERIKTGHGYGAQGLTDAQVGDLAEFVLAGAFDVSTIIPVPGGAFTGTPATGAPLYATSCAGCHGATGLTMPPATGSNAYFNLYPGFLSNDNPEETQHKISFGHPGSSMSGLAATLSTADLSHLGAFSQTLPSMLPVPAGAPDLLNGGQLYDKWWAVTGATPPTTDHPEWAAQTTNLRTGSDTWRCKECHGWDYIGAAGRYATGSHFTGFAGIYPGMTLTDEQVYNKIWTDHQYGNKLSDDNIRDLVEFVQAGQLDITAIVATTGGAFIGSTANGSTLYNGAAACATCHDADGLRVPPLGSTNATFSLFPGFLSNDNPEETQHKISYGHPGSAMAGQALALTDAQIGEVGAHSQTLPAVAP